MARNNKATAPASATSELAAKETDDSVLDESESEEYAHSRFKITSYGADMTAFELTHG
jgi:hypothetical protein